MILCNVVNNMMLNNKSMMLTVNGCDCMEALNAMVAEKERVQLLQRNCRFNITKLQDRAISWPPENLLIELLTGIVTTVNVNTINQAQSTLQSHLKELFLAVVRFSPPHD